MHKRAPSAPDSSRPPKRPRPDHASAPAPPVEEIHFARQLTDALVFRQDGLAHLRAGLASFKAFLESILYRRDDDARPRQLSILREYLDTQRPAPGGEGEGEAEKPLLPHLWLAWGFADTQNNDHMVSAVAALLALLLRTLAGLLDLREYGLLLGRAVLMGGNLRLVKRGLEAARHKEFVISPCLRLLTEAVGFDGGVLAGAFWRKRELACEVGTMRRGLGMVKVDVPEEEKRRRPSVRTLTVRYILTYLKYLSEGGRADILKAKPLCTALFHHLHEDPADLVNELLSSTEQYVFKDSELPRSAKSALLVEHNLERVTEVATRSEEDHAAAPKALSWLHAVCTTPSYGILRTSSWYPAGTARLEQQAGDDSIDLGLDSIEFYDASSRPDVRNSTLLAWIQTLRPHANSQERELFLTCSRSAPELVAAYFAEKNMQLDPKLTNTWIGYASLMFEVMMLPVPEFLGMEKGWAPLPPQTNYMIENILPRPLTQKVLTKCLNQSNDLITFFAVRILVLACQKMLTVQEGLEKGAVSSNGEERLWRQASERLTERFTERCPKMKDVINTFRQTPDDDDHVLQREAIARLIELYYRVTPLQALEEQFDVAAALTSRLVRSEQPDREASGAREMRALELEHLLQIARRSQGMKWFSKQGSLEFSPVVTLLKIHCKDVRNRTHRELLCYVIMENNILKSEAACGALVAAVRSDDGFSAALGAFLDDCFVRATKKPVKYLDDLDAIAAGHSAEAGTNWEGRPSLLNAVLLEQAAFVLSKDSGMRERLTNFIAVFVGLLQHTEENCEVLKSVQKKIVKTLGSNSQAYDGDAEQALAEVRLPTPDTQSSTQKPSENDDSPLISFANPPTESDNHPELFRWMQKDLDLALEDGDIASLMLCLCSPHQAIRTQAISQLRKVEDKLLNSTIEDKDPIYVLVGELLETYERHCQPREIALPYLTGTFASRALKVQMQPIHPLYPKVNRYLNKGAEWRIAKMPAYWLAETVLSQPEEDDSYWREVQWVLDWVVDGLRTTADLEVLRRGGTFEKVMAICSSPGVKGHGEVRERVLELVWRATFVEGGSSMLITRAGALSWLDMGKGRERRVEMRLKTRLLETCNKERIEAWAGMGVDRL